MAAPTERVQGSLLVSLTCARCGHTYEPPGDRRACDCGGTLLADYRGTAPALAAGNVWSYSWLLPVGEPRNRVTLGEGATPLIDCERGAAQLGIAQLLIKNEGQQPTGTFKSRGAAVSVGRALELGKSDVALATAGNSGIAWAAYAAHAGLTAHVFVPTWTAREVVDLLHAYGAKVELVDGPVSTAAEACARATLEEGWWPVGAWAEPYRVEGDKTLGLELLSDPRATAADAVLWPCASGIGLVGSWKAVTDLRHIGVEATLPPLIGVQSETCAPLFEAWEAGASGLVAGGHVWTDVGSVARGLLAPAPSAADLILRVVGESGGAFAAVSDAEIVAAAGLIARAEGLLLAPESAAAVAAVLRLRKAGRLTDVSRVVIIATGAARPSDYLGWAEVLL